MILLAELIFRVFQSSPPGVLVSGADMINDSVLCHARMHLTVHSLTPPIGQLLVRVEPRFVLTFINYKRWTEMA